MADAPRMLGTHEGIDGKAYRRAWTALVAEFGSPPHQSLFRLEMGRCAAAWTTLEAAQRRLADARRRRDTLKSHRPTESMILRLEKRAGLADESYGRAVDRLRELVARNSKPVTSGADLLALRDRGR
jgi:hypothetical protein